MKADHFAPKTDENETAGSPALQALFDTWPEQRFDPVILARQHPAGASRGAFASARCGDRRVTRAWDYSIDADENLKALAKHLAETLGMFGCWVAGYIDANDTWVYTRISIRGGYPNAAGEFFATDDPRPASR